MLAERVDEWVKQWKKEGIDEVLIRLLERRFGPLSEDQRSRIRDTDADTLLLWSERVLTAKTLDEVIAPHGNG